MTSDSDDTTQIGDTAIHRLGNDSAFFFEAGLAIDADGAPNAYGPDNSGLDWTANAGSPGDWWGVATDDAGEPFVQGPGDPAPGFYVSTTALEDSAFASSDPRRYVDSSQVPFIVLPPSFRHLYDVRLGDLTLVFNRANGNSCAAVFADIGPDDALGEGSIALADALGINSDPRHGGAAANVVYVVFPGSSIGWPADLGAISATVERLFADWGGIERLNPFLE